VAETPAAETAARRLIDLANQRGGHDNITVVVARVRSE
jgi:serine/threonine protein phosphatase PrpC